MEDVRIARALETGYYSVTLAAGTATRICSADPKRTKLVIFTPAAGVTIAPGPLTASATAGIPLSTMLGHIVIDQEQYGRSVMEEWNAFQAAGGGIVGAIASTLQKE